MTDDPARSTWGGGTGINVIYGVAEKFLKSSQSRQSGEKENRHCCPTYTYVRGRKNPSECVPRRVSTSHAPAQDIDRHARQKPSWHRRWGVRSAPPRHSSGIFVQPSPYGAAEWPQGLQGSPTPRRASVAVAPPERISGASKISETHRCSRTANLARCIAWACSTLGNPVRSSSRSSRRNSREREAGEFLVRHVMPARVIDGDKAIAPVAARQSHARGIERRGEACAALRPVQAIGNRVADALRSVPSRLSLSLYNPRSSAWSRPSRSLRNPAPCDLQCARRVASRLRTTLPLGPISARYRTFAWSQAPDTVKRFRPAAWHPSNDPVIRAAAAVALVHWLIQKVQGAG